MVHWSIESVDDDQAIGLARITSQFGESVIDEDVRVVLTASESGSGTITFGTADPRPAEWTDDQLTVVNAEIDDRIYTPATLDEAATARRVLLDAAKIARDEAAATTTLPPTTYQLIGVVTLDSSSIEGAWDTCRGTGGYGDFGAGMNVAVRDDVGAIVANTSTRHFAEDEFFEDPMADQAMSLELNLAKRGGATAGTCTVLFALDVPEVEFYEVQVGRRGSLVYSFDDLDDQNWRLHLSLGS